MEFLKRIFTGLSSAEKTLDGVAQAKQRVQDLKKEIDFNNIKSERPIGTTQPSPVRPEDDTTLN